MPADSETQQVEVNCRVCGLPFTACRYVLPDKRVIIAGVCDKCYGAKVVAIREDAAKKEATTERWLQLCPILYQRTDPARLPQTQLPEVLAWQYGPEGLLLVGPTGTYKTRTAYLLLKRLVLDEGRRVEAFDGLAFDHECVRRFRDEGDGEEWADGLAHVMSCSLMTSARAVSRRASRPRCSALLSVGPRTGCRSSPRRT